MPHFTAKDFSVVFLCVAVWAGLRTFQTEGRPLSSAPSITTNEERWFSKMDRISSVGFSIAGLTPGMPLSMI